MENIEVISYEMPLPQHAHTLDSVIILLSLMFVNA